MKFTTKIYEVNGIKYRFSSNKLQDYMSKKKMEEKAAGNKLPKFKIMENIAELLCVSPEAIKNWMYGMNGPSDLEQIKNLGNFFGVSYLEFLEKEDAIMNNKEVEQQYSIYTKDRIREIYHAMLGFIYTCQSYYADEYLNDEKNASEEDYTEKVHEAWNNLYTNILNINTLLERSMLDISEESYKKIESYIWDELHDYISLAVPDKSHGDNFDGAPYDEDWIESANEYFAKYLEGGYRQELRSLFEEYMVK